MSAPLVSVVMAAYNAQEYLNIAIDSILLQTYKNIELIVIDDGSADQTAAIVKNYSGRRVRYYFQKNQGLPAALNSGISKAGGKYIARMDADDISEPSRIEKQVGLMEKNKDVALVGTNFYLVDENGSYLDTSRHLDRPEDLRLEIFTRNPLGHGTVMVRKSVLGAVGGYDRKEPIEDYELWWRIIQNAGAANIPEELYSWRVVSSGMSHGSSEKRQKPIHELMAKIWQNNPPGVSLSQIKEGLSHYDKLGPDYLEQYKYMLACLYLGAYKMGRRAYAARLRIILLMADPGFRHIIRDLRQNPRSHNYNLSNLYK
jgi:glycosyltransferase involved in cell wall biosynthesis